ncbi:ATP-binding protein [Ochrobactrum intermedium]|nr:ATP-binding protein [Brucella intermedia]
MVFDNDAEVINVRGDRQAIERAITNLFQNAIDHGDKQGTIAISVLRPAVIEVADEGKGIPSDMRRSIFEPFSRVLMTKAPGRALGLILSNRSWRFMREPLKWVKPARAAHA